MTHEKVRINLFVPKGTYDASLEIVESGKHEVATDVPEFIRVAIAHEIERCKGVA